MVGDYKPTPTTAVTSQPSPAAAQPVRKNKYKIDDSYVVPEPMDLNKLMESESPDQVGFSSLFFLFNLFSSSFI